MSGNTNLFFADGAVLESPVAQRGTVCARVATQASLAGLVKQVEHNDSGDPQDDSKAARNDAVGVARADWASKRALQRERQDGDRGEEVGRRDCEQYNGRREVGVGGPCHGQLAMAQIEVPVTAIYFERVDQHADYGAAEDDDEEAQT